MKKKESKKSQAKKHLSKKAKKSAETQKEVSKLIKIMPFIGERAMMIKPNTTAVIEVKPDKTVEVKRVITIKGGTRKVETIKPADKGKQKKYFEIINKKYALINALGLKLEK